MQTRHANSAPTVVGYQNKDAHTDLNYVAPTFCTVTATDQSFKLQDIQLDAEAGNYACELRVPTARHQLTEVYTWFKKNSSGVAGPKSNNRWPVPEGKNGLWFLTTEEDGDPVYTYNTDEIKFRMFAYGTAFEINSDDNSHKLCFSGAATDATVSFPLRTDLNYVGNPYPVEYRLQNVNLDEDAGNYACEIRVLSSRHQFNEVYTWFKKNTSGVAGPKSNNRWPVPEGMNGLWFLTTEEDGDPVYTYNTDEIKNKTLSAGEGLEVNADDNTHVLSFTAPFELNPAK